MAGNTVVLGLSIIVPPRSRVLDAALAILAFGAGVFIAAEVLLRVRRADAQAGLKAGTILETPFAILFAVLWIVFPEGAPDWAVPAMIARVVCSGIQSAAGRNLKLSGLRWCRLQVVTPKMAAAEACVWGHGSTGIGNPGGDQELVAGPAWRLAAPLVFRGTARAGWR